MPLLTRAESAADRAVDGEPPPSGRRPLRARVATALAFGLVLLALLLPDEADALTPAGFVRLPLEAALGVAALLLAPARARRVLAGVGGALLGLLTVSKVMDLGFSAVLARPFDPVLDWISIEAAVEFVEESAGGAGAVAAVAAAAALAVAVVVLMTLSVLRLSGAAVRHGGTAAGSASVLGIAWALCAASGVQIVPDTPVAGGGPTSLAYDRAVQIRAGLRDQEVFAAQAAVDAHRGTPGTDLLTGLRGKDVVVAFVESYGRDAVQDPQYAPQVGALLDAGGRRLREAGFASRSGFLTSPTAGGGSWLAHATLLSGLWIDNQQRYRGLVSSDRLTLNGAFRRASWRTVAVMPGITRAWPEGDFFGYDKVYDSRNLGYRGPRFSFATMPDQYTLSAFERLERARRDRAPVMAEIPLVSSHAPWSSVSGLVDWDRVGDGSVFNGMPGAGMPPWPDRGRVRTEYRRSIEYTLNTLISYMEKYGDDDLVLVFLGDHQPAPLITGDGATRDVPITIVARDPAVLERISGWGWHDGLRPGPDAPVWPMHTFRDRFLTAFGPRS
ncbi:sulfatase [Actinomadura rugatobispora]|uniref:Sulfatase n=1 Tax=Actinomadura rugatobispora TaxID=1994 RepID=A0ABW0ZR68_9ACTN|nr:hypothetical protein GCM10010200_002840 [Actinomadura rugatobispora]